MKKWKEDTWNVIVAWHECPNLHIENGCKYCLHENGSAWCQKDQCPISNHSLGKGRENMQEYQKYEFCQADACPFEEITGGCPVKPENCYRTVKQFHHWLKENGYRIIKDA